MRYARSEAGAMGYVRSDTDDNESSDTIRKRLKFPKKLLEDCNGVHLTSVPRKLRSAFKKRSCTSVSPNLLACKKLKWQDISVNSPKDAGTSLLLSKDEEEVAQALFALSSVIPGSDKTFSDELDGEQSGDKHSNRPNTSNSGSLVEEAVAMKTKVGPRASLQDHDESISPVMEGTASDVTVHPFVNDTKQPGISTREKFFSESGGDVPKVNLHLTATMSERNSCGSNGSSRVADIKFQPRSKLRSGGNLPSCNFPQTTREQTGTTCGLLEGQCFVVENRNTGSPFWPGSTLRINCNGEGLHPVNPLTVSHKSNSPAQKDSKVVPHSNKSWKRCLTHAHICHYIKDRQASINIKGLPMLSSQKISEGPKSGDRDNRLVGMRNSLLGVGSSNGFPSPSRDKNGEEVRNAILLHKRLVQYQQQTSTAPFCGQKQSFGHFSLPTGYSEQASNGMNVAGRKEGTSSDLFSFLQSHSQPAIHFPFLQNYYASTSIATETSSAALTQQVMLPPYIGLSPLSALPPQQQLQKKAATLPVVPNRPGVNLPYIPLNWQAGGGGVVDISPLLQQTHNPFHPSCSSVEVMGTNYATVFLK